eukprot:TRINITY_DN5641_c0_g1_i3.p1 TRINITY_DN5641_c0_g1~~TRINITY_DN5641_c0_g1_i3.p1  ORF type:complete len:207 (+),score=0.61 TRINITY_DN5641_c0_g1_i3:65-685(+)
MCIRDRYMGRLKNKLFFKNKKAAERQSLRIQKLQRQSKSSPSNSPANHIRTDRIGCASSIFLRANRFMSLDDARGDAYVRQSQINLVSSVGFLFACKRIYEQLNSHATRIKTTNEPHQCFSSFTSCSYPLLLWSPSSSDRLSSYNQMVPSLSTSTIFSSLVSVVVQGQSTFDDPSLLSVTFSPENTIDSSDLRSSFYLFSQGVQVH